MGHSAYNHSVEPRQRCGHDERNAHRIGPPDAVHSAFASSSPSFCTGPGQGRFRIGAAPAPGARHRHRRCRVGIHPDDDRRPRWFRPGHPPDDCLGHHDLRGLAGTDAVNTVYLYGHSWVDPAVFNGLKDLPPGAVAAVDTARGTLCYVVQKTLELNKAAYKSNDELTRIIPNRLVLVSCYRPVGYDPGSATVQNIVVVLQLDRHATTAGC
ncbi:class F sortase [Cryobacterium breve]|uniref:Class F sortase n=1 Tax=Cryobacterium breve TaxID=1259258 RepID=A0ABY7NL33_9MICO|nr:class F sortase [Cryobacterium breve]